VKQDGTGVSSTPPRFPTWSRAGNCLRLRKWNLRVPEEVRAGDTWRYGSVAIGRAFPAVQPARRPAAGKIARPTRAGSEPIQIGVALSGQVQEERFERAELLAVVVDGAVVR
jgi:hypothetical protein